VREKNRTNTQKDHNPCSIPSKYALYALWRYMTESQLYVSNINGTPEKEHIEFKIIDR